MTIRIPSSYGIILRKSPASEKIVSALKAARRAIAGQEDELLFAFSAGQNTLDLQGDIDKLKAAGCTEGLDFVVTSTLEGVLSRPMPGWLREERTKERWEFRHQG